MTVWCVSLLINGLYGSIYGAINGFLLSVRGKSLGIKYILPHKANPLLPDFICPVHSGWWHLSLLGPPSMCVLVPLISRMCSSGCLGCCSPFMHLGSLNLPSTPRSPFLPLPPWGRIRDVLSGLLWHLDYIIYPPSITILCLYVCPHPLNPKGSTVF